MRERAVIHVTLFPPPLPSVDITHIFFFNVSFKAAYGRERRGEREREGERKNGP
jgi:hypothetical protein